MDNLTLTAENGILSHIFGAGFPITAPIKVALLTAMGTDTVPGTEVTGGVYARQDFNATVATSGQVLNSTAILFPDLPGVTVVGLELWDSSGKRLWHGTLAAPFTVVPPGGMMFEPGSVAIQMGGLLGPRASKTTITSLEPNSSSFATIELGRSFRVLGVTTNVPSRVRLYSTEAQRLNDLSRPIGAPVSGNHGLILEYVSDQAHLSSMLSPQAEGSSLEAIPTPQIPMTIQNRSNAVANVTVTLTSLVLET